MQTALLPYKTIRRNGELTEFIPEKISTAMSKAFLAVSGDHTSLSDSQRDKINQLTQATVSALTKHKSEGSAIHIEEIQDQVELALMRSGEHEVARAYVLYREKQAQERRQQETQKPQPKPQFQMTLANGQLAALDMEAVFDRIKAACNKLDATDPQKLLLDVERNIYNGITSKELDQALLLAARIYIETEPEYSYVAAHLLLQTLAAEALEQQISDKIIDYKNYFSHFIQTGIDAELLNPALAEFDLPRLAEALVTERDFQFDYLGLQTLYDRYFLHIDKRRIELPQAFFMRVAMGLALNEADKNARAIEFYEVLSQFDFMASTPTLFNSGTRHSQLSSCYLTTIADDLDGIFESIKDNALLSKFAGGLGNDWTPVRALGARIKGTNGQSQGVIPFLKVVNDTAVAVNQGGKRKGAVCAFLETWHADIEEFLNLRKNTGDERRRTHDMNTANWIPDLFMQRVQANEKWSLFSPDETADLHELYGEAFKIRYEDYEQLGEQGQLKLFKQLPAVDLWRKMLSMLFETGHPWINFKDSCNIRSPQQHVGVVHSSNLCTEITLNTNQDEIAVCNLGSVNLARHINQDGSLNHAKLQKTVSTAMRMLDNVVDINFYPVDKARNSNMKHRPVGLGLMAFQDALHLKGIAYASEEAVNFADESTEAISYYAFAASCQLAQERGAYETFKGSLSSKGILPIDSIKLLEQARGGNLEMDTLTRMDWASLREQIKTYGLRNSNCMAIAPTATIANIVGVTPSIEPNYQNLYVKSNLSGEFTLVNTYLVEQLKKLGLWDDVMVADLKYYDGRLSPIGRIPEYLKAQFATAFEIEPQWLVKAASRRQKWIDQAQSLNLYVAEPSGRLLNELYMTAWKMGLKTTYYLRTLGASHAEKSTGQGGELNAVSAHLPKACSIDNPDCEACQ